ncbi:MAG TPA: Gldg family protein [Thermoanaerobaculia bacterium]|nr:Gldg family protein [Thermoanaerobaculia bacterium]
MRVDTVRLAAATLFACLAAVLAARLADRAPGARWEVGRERVARLDDQARTRLAGLEDQVFVTFYATAPARMPTSLRGLERRVVDLLTAMKSASKGRLDFEVVDPDASPELTAYAARRQVAPHRVRDIRGDAWTEQTVWSTLTVEYGAREPIAFRGVDAEHFPFLQSALLGALEHLEAPRAPVLALAAPPGFEGLRAALSRFGRVVEVDPAGAGRSGSSVWLPDEADALFWMEPGDLAGERLVEIERFLESGRSVVLATSRLDGVVSREGGAPGVRVHTRPYGASSLFVDLGLEPSSRLVLDTRAMTLASGGEALPMPVLVRATAYEQDFRGLFAQPNGSLLFAFPTPLVPQPDRLARRRLTAQHLVTTSDGTWVRDVPDPETLLHLDDSILSGAEPAPKLPLAVLLRPTSPGRGLLVALAASTPLADDVIDLPGYAHHALLRILLETVAGDERLVLARAVGEPPPAVPAMSYGTRLALRLGVVLLGPILLLLVALLLVAWRRPLALLPATRRGIDARARARAVSADWGVKAQRGEGHRVAEQRVGVQGIGVQGIGVQRVWTLSKPTLLLAAVLSAAWAAGGRGVIDLTAGDLNTPAAATVDAMRRAAEHGPLRAHLYFSARERLPPELRMPVRRLETTLAALGRRGPPIEVSRTQPEDLGAEEREALEDAGISAARLATEDDGRSTVRSFFATLVLSAGERREVLRFADGSAFADLEFRVAFALDRLATGRRPHVGLASDVPRLTPAEAHENYQTKGLAAPSGSDPYAAARALIEERDFRVTHIDPRSPDLPDDLDLLVWLQPRRPSTPMLFEVVGALRRGVPILIAAQHFNMQPRQYQGRQFRTVYWPQPQWPELERDGFYLPELGVVLVREVLFDRMSTRMRAPSQVHRGERIEYELMESALPFVLRVTAPDHPDRHPLTVGIGDQVLPWAARIELDRKRLAANGLSATVLLTTSPRSWSYLWEGGWVPEELLDGPGVGDDGEPAWLGSQPLAVLLEGAFPPWTPPEEEAHRLRDRADLPRPPESPPRPSKLVLLGSSEVFKDHRLAGAGDREELRGDHLLLNAVAWLALGDELGGVISRRAASRGIGLVAPAERVFWRVFAPAAAPVLLVAFSVFLARRRRPQAASGREPAMPAARSGRGALAARRWLRWATGAAVCLATAHVAVLRADRGAGDLTDRLGSLLPASEREGLTVAVIRVDDGALGQQLYARDRGLWRCPTWRNALARPIALEGLVRAVFEAQGRVDASGGPSSQELTRLSLHGPDFVQDTAGRDELFAAEIGGFAPGGRSYVRRDDGRVWLVDRDLRAALGSPPAPGVPSLVDPAVVPEAWWTTWGPRLERVEVERDGASWSMVRRPRSLTRDELAAGALPFAWYSVAEDPAGAGEERALAPEAVEEWLELSRIAPWEDVVHPQQIQALVALPETARLTLVPSEGEPAVWVLASPPGPAPPIVVDLAHDAAYVVSPQVAGRLFPRAGDL